MIRVHGTGVRAALVVSAALVAGAAGPGVPAARAQSVFGSAGLGTPVAPLSARARVLGGVGVGLYGTGISPVDPVAASGAPFGILEATMQPHSTSSEGAVTVSDAEGTRFPLVGIAYPVTSGGVATLTFGSFLEQRYGVTTERTITLSGAEVPVVDEFESRGGVSAFGVGWSQEVGSSAAVGANVGVHTGEIDRLFSRRFDTAAVGAPVEDFRVRDRWRLTGTTVTVGGRWDPLPVLRVAASAELSSPLTADPRLSDDGVEKEYDLPVRLRAGGTARLTPALHLVAGVAWADWSETGDDLSGGGAAGTTWDLGSGVEWRGGSLLGRPLDLRLGYHRSPLPFEVDGEQPTESYVAGGLAVTLAESQERSIASLDLSVERGGRDGARISESWWGATVTLRLAGR